jgi:hypothetical protein
MLYLLMRALEVVYIIDFIRAVAVVCFQRFDAGDYFCFAVYLLAVAVLFKLGR